MALVENIEAKELANKERKKQIAQAVKRHRELQQKRAGRKQTPLMLTDEDRANLALIKKNEENVKNQGEAVSLALAEYVDSNYGKDYSD